MKKIAFLFLTIENINFPAIWDKYLKNNKRKISIYIHAKRPEKVTWHADDVLGKIHETEWGFITRAYLELMAEAFKDAANFKFVTISESCVPIKSFADFYDAATGDEDSWIARMQLTRYDLEHRLSKAEGKPPLQHIMKHAARFCLNREHVEQLLQRSPQLEYFHNMHVGDEFFLSVLQPLKHCKNFAVTYDDWDYVENIKREIKTKIRKLYEKQEKTRDKRIDYGQQIKTLQNHFNDIAKNPKTITDVADDLMKIKKCKSFFYRKFSADSNIGEYWKEIIGASSAAATNTRQKK